MWIPADLATPVPALWDPKCCPGTPELYISALENNHSDTVSQGRN